MQKKIIYLIFLIAVLTRFTSLTDLPPALNRDEAAIGYNAYSILKTNRDEHGQFMPLAFKSIGDYKMPLYIYATVLPVKFFGLNDFSIRFWSAFAGVTSVIAIYYLVLELTKKKLPATIAALLLTLNPWAIFYSRIGFEANLALAFFLTGLCMLLRGLKKPTWLYGGLSLFLFSFLTYSSSLIFIPLFLIIFFFVYRYQLKLAQPTKFIILAIFTLVSIFIFKSLWTISAQKSNITVFSDPQIISYYNQTRTAVFETNPLLARTWWNKYVFFTRTIVNNYFKTFSFKFLLTEGGNHPWHKIPGVGSFYYLEIILAISGLWWVIRKKKYLSVLLPWLLLAPIPSAITIDAPHATRSLYLLPIVLILASLALANIWPQLKKKKIITLLVFLYLINLSYVGFKYIIDYPKNISQSLSVGLRESIEFVNSKNLSGNIYLTDIHDSTYLYPLIYAQFDPAVFQKQAVWTKPDTVGLTNVYKFDQFTIVDDLNDIKDPAVVILPQGQNYLNQPAFSSANYQVYLP